MRVPTADEALHLRPAALEPDSIITARAGGVAVEDAAAAAAVLLQALQDARDELARRVALANAGSIALAVLVPQIGVVRMLGFGSEAAAEVETVIAAVDQTLAGAGPRLVARVRNGEVDKLEDLRRLVENLADTLAGTVVDEVFLGSEVMRFLRDVVARSVLDLVEVGRQIPGALPGVGMGLGALLLGLAAVIFAVKR